MADERTELTLKALGSPPKEVKQTEMTYTTRDGHKNRAKLFQPTNPPKDGSPLIVMFHGGGFCIGSPEGEEQSCRSFVQAFGAVCVSPAYRLGPEYKFPYS
jgi:acetyl esterase/lipase